MKRRRGIEFWILDADHQPIPATMLQWAEQLSDINARIVRKSRIGEVEVSTVFIGLDHRWLGKGPPLIFETMIFGGAQDSTTWRCSTWDEALLQHRKACQVARIKETTDGESSSRR